jgi:hypothetical protein
VWWRSEALDGGEQDERSNTNEIKRAEEYVKARAPARSGEQGLQI